MLYKNLLFPDRHQTQLAYRIKFWPWTELSESGRKLVYSNKTQVVNCQWLEDNISAGDWGDSFLLRGTQYYEVVWAFNCVPTKLEWEAAKPDGKITVEYRRSPAIKDKRVAILRFIRDEQVSLT